MATNDILLQRITNQNATIATRLTAIEEAIAALAAIVGTADDEAATNTTLFAIAKEIDANNPGA